MDTESHHDGGHHDDGQHQDDSQHQGDAGDQGYDDSGNYGNEEEVDYRQTIKIQIDTHIDEYERVMGDSSLSEEDQQNSLRRILRALKRHAKELRDMDPDDPEVKNSYKLFKYAHTGRYVPHEGEDVHSHVPYKHDLMGEESEDNSDSDSDSDAGSEAGVEDEYQEEQGDWDQEGGDPSQEHGGHGGCGEHDGGEWGHDGQGGEDHGEWGHGGHGGDQDEWGHDGHGEDQGEGEGEWGHGGYGEHGGEEGGEEHDVPHHEHYPDH
ncbi:hypothetical protein AYO20_06530 [Fonsecaea nubica]|uniref:Uncharacterized protein n=1 Tax=Fonsecaea nubica TaxID=856822 RepID=A0A178CYL9_9EURO|nr:hypothetical protein AYO20_06530 [Fonsecaea nubica]OAL34274.1 hypothetical protein AYO20_06530 [Fonsecaea nubica]